MKPTTTFFKQTRRHFLGVLAAMGALISWPVTARSGNRLSKKEASFYRKGQGRKTGN